MRIPGAAVGAAAAMAAAAAWADPALIYNLGGKFDKSFNENAYIGAERWKSETGGDYRDIELLSHAHREQALRALADAGHDPVVMTGFAFVNALGKVAPDFPDTTFVIIDGIVDLPNVRSLVYKEHEGSFLVGMAAAMATKSGTVGFVGGMDVPLIRRVACGYVQGVHAVDPDVRVVVNMTGNDSSAWSDPVKGAEIARIQISEGADVIFQGAGGTGIGVMQAAADEGVMSIGSDANQNYLHPGSVLTSMVKHVELAVFDAFSGGEDLQPGIFTLGLAENGVGYTVDEHNAGIFSGEMVEAVEAAKSRVISGEISVHDYSVDSSCPSG